MLIDSPAEIDATSTARVAYCGLLSRCVLSESLALCSVFDSVDAYAAGFYEFLREVGSSGGDDSLRATCTGRGNRPRAARSPTTVGGIAVSARTAV